MNPTPPPDHEQEAKLTAFLLGELSESESAQMRAALASDPQLKKLHDRLALTLGLVKEAMLESALPTQEQPEPLKLSSEKRNQLLQQFKIIRPVQLQNQGKRRFQTSDLVTIAALFICLFLIAAMVAPNFVRARTTAQRFVSVDAKFANVESEEAKSANTFTVNGQAVNDPPKVHYQITRDSRSSGGLGGGGGAGGLAGASPVPPGVPVPPQETPSVTFRNITKESLAEQSNAGRAPAGTSTRNVPQRPSVVGGQSRDRSSRKEVDKMERTPYATPGNNSFSEEARSLGRGDIDFNKGKDDGLNLNVFKLDFERPLTEQDWQAGYQVEQLIVNELMYDDVQLGKESTATFRVGDKYSLSSREEFKREFAPARAKKPAGTRLPEVQTKEQRFSTFSLNVTDVSYQLAAASLEKGTLPDPATIRSEEFINAFTYNDPEANSANPVAFQWQRARHPFEHNRDLIRFSVKTAPASRQGGQLANLVLLLDNSGSMERADRQQIVRECLRSLGTTLQPHDKISVVGFARTAKLHIDGLYGNQSGELVDRVGNITPEGGTNLEAALDLAYQTAMRHFVPGGINRVVLLTDGAANLGDVNPESLRAKVVEERKKGIALDCFGIGWEGFNDDLLEVLSRNGDGRYSFVNAPAEAHTQFAKGLMGALVVAAADVKVQVEFNPARVTAYRQIGYTTHQLRKEQFRDNTVDAAEIGGSEAGNALYTMQVNEQGTGPLGVVRVRYKVPATGQYKEQTWPLEYAREAASIEQSSPAMRLCVVAGFFAEWLSGSAQTGDVSTARLLQLLSGVNEAFPGDERPARLEWMIRQAGSLTGR